MDNEIASEEESFSTRNQKYKQELNKNCDTISIVDAYSVAGEDNNYKKNLEGVRHQKQEEKLVMLPKETSR